MVHVAQWKKEEIKALTQQVVQARVVGLVDIGGIPAVQMNVMRAGLRGRANLRVARSSLIRRALEQMAGDHDGLEKLNDQLGHKQVGLILASQNPFQLYRYLEQTKTSAPAKGGETAPADILVPKGPTPFKAGPVVGDLQQAGLPAAIEKGKVIIRKNHVAVKAGEQIPVKVAQALTKLEIHPLTVGLDLLGAWSEGVLFDKQTLALDPAQFYGELQRAIRSAHNLTLNAAIAVPGVMPQLIGKAHGEALALALQANIVTKATIEPLVGKAHRQMLALAGQVEVEAHGEKLQAALASQATAAAQPDPAEAPSAKEGQAGEGAEEAEEAEEEDEEITEEEALSGMSSLFG